MIIPHLTLDPDYTFGVSIAVITIMLAGYGVYKGFFANDGLTDPWDDHDDQKSKDTIKGWNTTCHSNPTYLNYILIGKTQQR